LRSPTARLARRIVAAARVRVFVTGKWRYHLGIVATARMARSGQLEKILAIRTVHLGWNHNRRDVDAIWILMPHDLAIASASPSDLRGGPAPRSSAAEGLPIVERIAALCALAGLRD
jgi:hypothetical protein